MDFDPTPHIKRVKSAFRQGADVKAAFDRCRDAMRREVDSIRTAHDSGRPVIPEVAYSAIADGSVTDADRAANSPIIR